MDKADRVIELVNEMRIEKRTLKDKLKRKSKKSTDLGNKLIDSEKKLGLVHGKCKEQKQHIMHLTHELGDAFDEISRLKKRLKDVEKDDQIKNDSLELELGENGRKPLTVFPEEVWEMIFDNLEDPKDLKNCYDANPLFQSVLRKKRKDFLITDVMMILAARGDFGNPSQTTSELLKYRAVNSSWKKSIDNLFQDEVFPPIFPTSTEYAFEHPKLYFENGHDDSERNRWRDFATLSADMNPMIGRLLEYEDSFTYQRLTQSHENRFREDFLEFLKKFGHHVWYFKIQIGDEYAQVSTAWFPLLKTCLTFLPNLKALHIYQPMFERWDEDWAKEDHYESTDSDGQESPQSSNNESRNSRNRCRQQRRIEIENLRQQRRVEIENLKEQLLSETFPTMESLRTLVLEDCLPLLVTSVLKNNPQIESLKIKRVPGNTKVACLKEIKLDSLQEFYLDVYKVDCSEIEAMMKCKLQKLSVSFDWAGALACDDRFKTCFWETVVELNVSGCYRWPPRIRKLNSSENMNFRFQSLKKLTITEMPDKSLLKFFQSLSERFGTVTELIFKIDEDTAEQIKPTEYLRLNMPSVKVLNLEIPHNYPSIDVVLLLLNLETLNAIVKLDPSVQDNKEQNEDLKDVVETIKFEQFIGNVRESNIWQLLPKLQQVNIRIDYLDPDSYFDIKKSTWQYCSRNQIKRK